MLIVAILIESLFNMFAFWFLDTEMATSWEIGIEKKKSKKCTIGYSIVGKNVLTQNFFVCLRLLNQAQVI